MNSKALIGLLAVILLVGVGVWFVGGKGADRAGNGAAVSTGQDGMDTMDMGSTTDATASSTSATSTASTTSGVTGSIGATKEFTVTGSNFSFVPTTLTVNTGDHVKITFKNTGGFHDFVLDQFNVKTNRINGGESVVVEFDATKAGSFEYYCSVGNHRAMGMKGTLVVK